MSDLGLLEESRIPNATESKLLEIWGSVLDTGVINLDADFFDLGGDSLSAMMCISRIRRIFNFEFSIEDFFNESATIASFASAIDAATASGH